MNQISIFDFLHQRTKLRLRYGVVILRACSFFTIMVLTTVVHAQNQFGSSTANGIPTPEFLPPPTSNPGTQNLNPPILKPQSWPQERVTFDSQVQTASFDPPSDAKTARSWNSMLVSAGPAISSFKDTVVSKASGMLGGMTGKPGGGTKLNLPKMLSSLAIVLGGYFAFVWVVRRISPASNSQLPPNVVQVLGRTAFGPKQTLQLVRLGSKLVLLLNGPEGTHPIGEITDPHEVKQLTATCSGSRNTNNIPFPQRAASTSPNPPSNPPNNSVLNAAGNSPVSNEQVQRSLTSVLRTLENATRQQSRGASYEA